MSDIKKEELARCPFCGREAVLKDFSDDEYCSGYAVCCENTGCGYCGTPIMTKEEVIKSWNTRA